MSAKYSKGYIKTLNYVYTEREREREREQGSTALRIYFLKFYLYLKL